MREIRAAHAAGHMQTRSSNLLLEPEVALVGVLANPSYRSANKHGLLSARAGDVDDALAAAPAERGFFVSRPGARRRRAERHAPRAVDRPRAARQMGQRGDGADADRRDARAACRVQAPRGLPADAWDPLHGPGWPGVYTDRRLAGVREAPPEDVLTAASWAEAFELFAQLKEAAPGSGGPVPTRAVFAIGADVTVDDAPRLHALVLQHSPRRGMDVGYDGEVLRRRTCTKVARCGVCVALSIMGGRATS